MHPRCLPAKMQTRASPQKKSPTFTTRASSSEGRGSLLSWITVKISAIAVGSTSQHRIIIPRASVSGTTALLKSPWQPVPTGEPRPRLIQPCTGTNLVSPGEPWPLGRSHGSAGLSLDPEPPGLSWHSLRRAGELVAPHSRRGCHGAPSAATPSTKPRTALGPTEPGLAPESPPRGLGSEECQSTSLEQLGGEVVSLRRLPTPKQNSRTIHETKLMQNMVIKQVRSG